MCGFCYATIFNEKHPNHTLTWTAEYCELLNYNIFHQTSAKKFNNIYYSSLSDSESEYFAVSVPAQCLSPQQGRLPFTVHDVHTHTAIHTPACAPHTFMLLSQQYTRHTRHQETIIRVYWRTRAIPSGSTRAPCELQRLCNPSGPQSG